MKTEKELKDRCTPDIIKKMVELAEGFDIYELVSNGYKIKVMDLSIVYFAMQSVDQLKSIFPLLIHRAVEGWNKTSGNDCIVVYGDRIEIVVNWNLSEYMFSDYQLENLTACECAMLHCLIEILGD